jgi:hypothetical protein
MNGIKYVVRYKVASFGDEEREAGPYDHVYEASQHMQDIEGYEGVHSVYVKALALRSSSAKVDDKENR